MQKVFIFEQVTSCNDLPVAVIIANSVNEATQFLLDFGYKENDFVLARQVNPQYHGGVVYSNYSFLSYFPSEE